MRKILVAVGSRANYSSIKSVLRAVSEHPDLQLQLVVGASALLDRYGEVIQYIEKDGFKADRKLPFLIEGETPLTMAKSTGLGLLELSNVLDQLEPDIVVTVGDRFETLATAIASVYMNIPLAHTMGGEITGTIDESVRHAVTKLAHIHFPATQQAAERIIRLGEDPETVYLTGCPRIDMVSEILSSNKPITSTTLSTEGVGADIDLNKPFLLVMQHPVTTEYGQGEEQVHELLLAIQELDLPTIMLWPNADAGSEDIARGIRKFREQYKTSRIRVYKNFEIDDFVQLMNRCACLVGNSSAAIREGAFIGVPAVNIGTRQQGRERGSNVVDAPHSHEEIKAAVLKQIAHGRYPSEHIYGDGLAGGRIADILAQCEIKLQKRITF